MNAQGFGLICIGIFAIFIANTGVIGGVCILTDLTHRGRLTLEQFSTLLGYNNLASLALSTLAWLLLLVGIFKSVHKLPEEPQAKENRF